MSGIERMVNLELAKKVAQNILAQRHVITTRPTSNFAFLHALQKEVPEAPAILYSACAKITSGSECLDANTLCRWLSNFDLTWLDLEEALPEVVISVLGMISAALEGDVEIEQCGQNMAVLRRKDGTRYVITSRGFTSVRL